MNRYRAALVHFAISALVVGSVFLVVYFLWYPSPFFEGAGGRDLFLVLALVDVTLGPLITLIIFVPGKKGLKFDLATIAVLQCAALAYGSWVVFEARPVWVVFLKDRFDLVRANQIDEAERAKAEGRFRELSLTGPKVVGARIPTDPQEQFRTAVTALAGMDVSSYPQHFVAYDRVRAEVLAKKKPLAELRALNPGRQAQVDRLLERHGRAETQLAFLPLRAGKRDLAVVVDARNADIVEFVALQPWKY